MPEMLKLLDQYPIKTRLSLSGTLIVARDIAHAKLQERINNGEGLPQYIKDHPVYYAGPAKTPEVIFPKLVILPKIKIYQQHKLLLLLWKHTHNVVVSVLMGTFKLIDIGRRACGRWACQQELCTCLKLSYGWWDCLYKPHWGFG